MSTTTYFHGEIQKYQYFLVVKKEKKKVLYQPWSLVRTLTAQFYFLQGFTRLHIDLDFQFIYGTKHFV